MLIRTERFGEIEVNDGSVIMFREGLPGFPAAKRFVIVERGRPGQLKWLQAVEDPALAFVIADPRLFKPDYRIQPRREDTESLEIEPPDEEIEVYAVVAIPEDPRMATVNLAAPIVVNKRKMVGKQLVLLGGGYSLRHRIFAGEAGGVGRAVATASL